MEHILATWGYVALFAITLISALGIPIGSEVATGYAGALASGQLTTAHDHLGLGWVILVAVLGELVGSIAGYSIGRFGGRPLVDKLGRYVLLTHRDLDRAEAWFARRGDPFVLFGRCIPFVRSFVSLAAGLGEMTVGRFLAYTVVGSAAYDALLAGIGFSLGASWHHVIRDFSDAGYALAALLVLAIIAVLVHRFSVVRTERAGRSPAGLEARVRAAAAHLPGGITRPLAALRIDFDPPPRQPKAVGLVVTTVTSIVGSLVADVVLVKVAEAVFPSDNGYAHFQFSDYAKLTVIGVVIACVAWPITTRLSSLPRWVFLRMAVLVTLVLWIPDLWILFHDGQPARAVAFLMLMHLAIAIVTYNALVHLAPARSHAATESSTAAAPLRRPRGEPSGYQTERGRQLGGWPPRSGPEAPAASGPTPPAPMTGSPAESEVGRPMEQLDPLRRGQRVRTRATDLVVKDRGIEPDAEWHPADGTEQRVQHRITTSRSPGTDHVVYFDRVCAGCGTRHLCRHVEGAYLCDSCRKHLDVPGEAIPGHGGGDAAPRIDE